MPYLTFHHFAPPWRKKHHHDPAGMVALCSVHAAKADQGYYPDEYFRELKIAGRGRAEVVTGEFDYLRRNALAIIGSNMFYEVRTILEVAGQRLIYFERDERGYLLLNFKLPGAGGAPRAWLENNVWLVQPGAEYIECPTRGKYLSVEFENGDRFRMEYSSIESAEQLLKKYPAEKYPAAARMAGMVEYPLAIAEFWEKAQSASIEFGRHTTRVGSNMISNSSIARAGVGISVGATVPGPSRLPADIQAVVENALHAFNSRRRP